MTQQKLDERIHPSVNNQTFNASEVLKKLQDELWED